MFENGSRIRNVSLGFNTQIVGQEEYMDYASLVTFEKQSTKIIALDIKGENDRLF